MNYAQIQKLDCGYRSIHDRGTRYCEVHVNSGVDRFIARLSRLWLQTIWPWIILAFSPLYRTYNAGYNQVK